MALIQSGQNNTATTSPTYCPPFPEAQMARLAGETTPSMCQFEPVVCGHRYYCPLGEKEKICVQKALTALAGHMSRSNVASVPTTRLEPT